jgi:hypothetical protein
MPNIHTTDARLAWDLLAGVQNRVSAADRDLIADQIAQRTNEIIDNPFQGAREAKALKELRANGITRAPLNPSQEICQAVVGYFLDTPCYNTHVPVYGDGVLRSPRGEAQQFSYGSYTLEQNLRAPHLIELALDARLLDLAGGYLGCLPSLYSINTFWTFPKPEAGLTHDWHRDEDDYRFLAVFVYWTDVTRGEGEFYFMHGTHDRLAMDAFFGREGQKRLWPGVHFFNRHGLPAGITSFDAFRRMNGGNGYANAPIYEKLFCGRIRAYEGPAGSSFVADTFGIHRGSLPATRPRLCTWFRYGLYANEAYRIDKTQAVPWSLIEGRVADDDRTRFICRLLAR